RPRRATDRGVPRPPRTRTRQQRAHPQRATSGDPLPLPLRRPPPPRAARPDRARARDPAKARRAGARHLSARARGRRPTRLWRAERGGTPDGPPFPTRTGGTLSHDALERRLSKYSPDAAEHCASLRSKRVTAHVLRHTAAMRLLHAGVDTSVIALWLGHEQVETTQIYLNADLALKEQAINRTTPPNTTPGRYHPPDTVLAFLQGL